MFLLFHHLETLSSLVDISRSFCKPATVNRLLPTIPVRALFSFHMYGNVITRGPAGTSRVISLPTVSWLATLFLPAAPIPFCLKT